MGLSIGLVKLAGATRCNTYGRRIDSGMYKGTFRPSLADWLGDSAALAKRIREERNGEYK